MREAEGTDCTDCTSSHSASICVQDPAPPVRVHRRLAACSDAVLWGIDLKHGLELKAWEPVFEPGRIADTVANAEQLLRAAERVMNAHGDLLAHDGAKEWQPSLTRPALVIVIDEQGRLCDSPTAIATLERIATLGRALGVGIISATQHPTQQQHRGRRREQLGTSSDRLGSSDRRPCITFMVRADRVSCRPDHAADGRAVSRGATVDLSDPWNGPRSSRRPARSPSWDPAWCGGSQAPSAGSGAGEATRRNPNLPLGQSRGLRRSV